MHIFVFLLQFIPAPKVVIHIATKYYLSTPRTHTSNFGMFGCSLRFQHSLSLCFVVVRNHDISLLMVISLECARTTFDVFYMSDYGSMLFSISWSP
jgi:hypothetical protein